MTGHDSLDEFLYKRGLSETEECNCDAVSKDWKHVLVEFYLHNDIRKLNEYGVKMQKNGRVDVSVVLDSKNKYKSLYKFAEVFEKKRRTRNVQ